MKEIKNKYGLRLKSTGEIVGYEISSNSDGHDCVENQYILEVGAEKIWLVDDPQHAEYVRLNSTEWYNAEYDTPTHNIYADSGCLRPATAEDLEVVEINVTIDAKPVEVSIPTPYEFFEAKYAKKEPRHWKQLKKTIEENAGTKHAVNYSWYDLIIFREDKK